MGSTNSQNWNASIFLMYCIVNNMPWVQCNQSYFYPCSSEAQVISAPPEYNPDISSLFKADNNPISTIFQGKSLKVLNLKRSRKIMNVLLYREREQSLHYLTVN